MNSHPKTISLMKFAGNAPRVVSLNPSQKKVGGSSVIYYIVLVVGQNLFFGSPFFWVRPPLDLSILFVFWQLFWV